MNEAERLRILNSYEILDTLPEKEFDDIVELAAELYGTPMSAISLLDDKRQWLKARIGLEDDSTPIEQAYCRYTILNPGQALIVNDSLEDDRFRENPLTTGKPFIRFYAGYPLVTDDGHALGAICVIDRKPRTFTASEERILKVLAVRIMKMIELRKENLEQKRMIARAYAKLDITVARYIEAQQTAHIGNWDFNVRTQELYWSPEMFRLLLKQEGSEEKGNLADWENLIHPDDLETVRNIMQNALTTRQRSTAEFRIISGGTETWLRGIADIALNADNRVERIFGTLQDITVRKKADRNRAHYTAMLEGILFDVSHKIRKPLTTLLGLLPILNTENISREEFAEVYNYFLGAVQELEGYTRELNNTLHKSKIDINGEAA